MGYLVFVLVGQAGVQVGGEFWRLVDQEYLRTHATFFNQRYGKARCVLVDSEPKVVKGLETSCKDLFLPDNIIYDQPGRGNNWAFGYYDKRTNSLGDTLADRVMAQVDREVAHAPDDSPSLFVVVHSVSGGTGSVSRLRETYKTDKIASVVVTPYDGGEVVLQSYNCLLCLAELSRNSDAILILSNEKAMKILEKTRPKTSTKTKKGIGSVSLHEINLYFSKCLAGIFFPTNPGPIDPVLMKSCGLKKFSSVWKNERTFDVVDFVQKMCPDKHANLIEVIHAPCYSDGLDVVDKNWGDIAFEIASVTPRYMSGKLIKTLGSQLIVRGDKSKTFLQEYSRGARDKLLKAFAKAEDFTPDIRVSLLPTIAAANCNQSITLCTNRDVVLEFLGKVIENASAKFTARAFVHWYHRYGCSDKVFEAAFQTMQSVVAYYHASSAV